MTNWIFFIDDFIPNASKAVVLKPKAGLLDQTPNKYT
jgi:hypothetical protein